MKSDVTASSAVVTGGAGFIGSHLVSDLIERGYTVTVLDDLSAGKEANLDHLKGESGLRFVRGSVTDTGKLREAFEKADYVFHLAAMASVPLSLEKPLECHEINSTGTLRVLNAARDSGVKKVVYISSCAIYGDADVMPIHEDTLPNPQSPYAVAKLTGEYYCRVFNSLYGLPTASLRFFNMYGPRQDPDSPYSAVIPLFIKRIMAEERPVIFGDGEQTRDFTFVEDAVQACILAAEGDAAGEYNVGSGVTTSIIDLARHIIRLSGKEIHPEYRAPRAGDIRFSSPDTTRIRHLGFRPSYSLEEGLEKTFKSMNE